MKFSSLETIAAGTHAERNVDLPVPGRDAPPVPMAMRPLSGAEDISVCAEALKMAKARGVESPTFGDPIYDLALWANTVAVSFVDVDSPRDKREPFFDGGAEQVLANLHPETIAYLAERQAVWQEECSPSVRAKSVGELFSLAKGLAEASDDSFFSRLSPRTRWSLARTLARLLLKSPEASSLFSSLAEPSTAT